MAARPQRLVEYNCEIAGGSGFRLAQYLGPGDDLHHRLRCCLSCHHDRAIRLGPNDIEGGSDDDRRGSPACRTARGRLAPPALPGNVGLADSALLGCGLRLRFYGRLLMRNRSDFGEAGSGCDMTAASPVPR